MKTVEILLLSLFLLLNLGYILTNSRKYLHLVSRRIQKMLYVMFSAIASGIVFGLRLNDIVKMDIFNEYPVNKAFFNIFAFWCTAFLIHLVWYWIFLSCYTIRSIVFKDTKITLNDAEQIKEITKRDEEDKRVLIRIINTRNSLIMNMNEYIEQLNDFSHHMYINIIRKYLSGKNGHRRSFIKYYFFSENGLNKIKCDFQLTDYEEADIRTLFQKHWRECCAYSLSCSRNKYLLKIHTMYTEEDIIIAINQKHFLQDEHKIIQSIVSVLDLYVHFYVQLISCETELK